MEFYRNLYYTRLIVMEGFEEGQNRKYPLGPDIFEECQAVVDLPEVDPNEWTPSFDPASFNLTHGPLEIENFRLTQADLRSWADRCVNLRRVINE